MTNASTAALVQALAGGGLVQMTFVDVLTLETPPFRVGIGYRRRSYACLRVNGHPVAHSILVSKACRLRHVDGEFGLRVTTTARRIGNDGILKSSGLRKRKADP